MLDFDERDLVDLAERAGFTDVRLPLQIEVKDQGQNQELGKGQNQAKGKDQQAA